MKLKFVVPLTITALLVAVQGTTPGRNDLAAAGIGAAGGVAIVALAGGPLVGAAMVGGAAGMAVTALAHGKGRIRAVWHDIG